MISTLLLESIDAYCDAITRCWKQIIYFRPKEAPKPQDREISKDLRRALEA